MAAFQCYLHSEKERKVGCVGDESRIVFGQKFPGEEGKYEMVSCQSILLSPEFGVKRLHMFMQ
jgi:hypothetical protein